MKMVVAAVDLLASRWERVGQVVLAGVRRPSGERNSGLGGQERLSEWGWQEDGGGGSPFTIWGFRVHL
jgi:hypothetical protein